MYINYYSSSAKELINLFRLDGISIGAENIKIWSPIGKWEDVIDTDIQDGINTIKSLDKDIFVYTNEIPLKDKLSEDSGIKIYDINDIIGFSLKHKQVQILDMILR